LNTRFNMKAAIWWLLAFFCVAIPARGLAQSPGFRVEFVHQHDGEPLRLDSLINKLSTGETYSIERLSYLVSGFALQRADESWLEIPNQVAWIDASRRRCGALLKDVRPAAYCGVRFSIGLDPFANATNPAKYPADHPLNPILNGLHWAWQGGYIFLAVEGRYRGRDSTVRGYSYHLARDENRTTVSLPLNIASDRGDHSGVRIVFDLGTLFRSPQAISFERDGAATDSRSGDPIPAALRANLTAAFRIEEIAGDDSTGAALMTAGKLDLPARFTPYRLAIGETFAIPALPRDNPLIEERVGLGKKLFHETILSRNGQVSCATCHDVGHAFAQPDRVSVGVDGRRGTRNAMPLFNLAWKSSFFWDGRAKSLREQVLMPIQDHVEMDESLPDVVAKLSDHPDYPELFARAFNSSEVTAERIGLALENYLFTLTSSESKFDRAMRGEMALSDTEKRGFELFFTEYEPRTGQFGADCFHCHGGALFTDNQFHNNGLAPTEDRGVFASSGLARDQGKFATPSLRNVSLTAPYMHDGRFATLEEVVGHYTSGIHRSPTLDPNLAKHPDQGLDLSKEDQRALVAFLLTLTDEKFPTGPAR
jgi:cytochrome c peroxidase